MAMARSSPAEGGRPAPGSKFFPADHVLITRFLRPRVAGLPIDGRCNIHDADAYSVSPDDLVQKHEHALGTDKKDGKGGEWYFFTPARRHETKTKNGRGRRQRAVGEGGYTWHSEGSVKAVLDDKGRRVGYTRKLSYGFKESPGTTRNHTRLGWCMTEFGLDDAAADLVLCKVCVSRHKNETTYASVMKATVDAKKRKATADPKNWKATADPKKRKAADDPHPDAPRPQTPRHQEMDLQELHEIERWLLSDEDDSLPAGAVDDGRVDPAGLFFSEILDVEEFCGTTQQRQAEDDARSEVTYEDLFGDDHDMDVVPCPAPAPASVSCGSGKLLGQRLRNLHPADARGAKF